jgi:ATP-dependent protease ClpP protease subunit
MSRSWLQIKNISPKEGELRIRGIIGYSNKSGEDWFGPYEGEGGTVKEIEEELRALGPIETLNVYISSEGGLVSTGLAINSILTRHSAKKIVHIDGYAYSIATVIAMAGDEIRMPANALLMIHNASTYAVGDYRDMEREAEALKAHNTAIRRAYAAKSGRDEKEFAALMDATTFMDGPTAKSLGLVDVVTTEMKLNNLSISDRFRASAEFAKMPARWSALFDTPPPATPPATHTSSITNMKPLIALATALGITLPENATEDQAIAAFKAHKAPDKNVIIDFEDTAVKAAFAKAITDATQADKAEITALKTELGKITALLANGPAAAAGGNPAIPGALPAGGTKTENTKTRAEFEVMNAQERAEFFRNKGKLID